MVHVVLGLESESAPIRQLAMRLLSRVSAEQLKAVDPESIGARERDAHLDGLAALKADQLDKLTIAQMVGDTGALTRRYGAIAARRWRLKLRDLVSGVDLPDDEDVRALVGQHRRPAAEAAQP